jgi:hypothetical protein
MMAAIPSAPTISKILCQAGLTCSENSKKPPVIKIKPTQMRMEIPGAFCQNRKSKAHATNSPPNQKSQLFRIIFSPYRKNNVATKMKMMMTENMTNTTRDTLLLRSSRESLRLFGGETLVTLFIVLLPDILAVRKLDRNPFYLFLRGNDRN